MEKIYVPKYHDAYPDDEHGHMFPCKIVNPHNYDLPFEFRVKSKLRKFQRFWVESILFLLGPILTYFRFAPKYENKNIIRKYKDQIRQGFMTISNHVLPWDNIVLRNVFKFHRVEMPIWKEGAESSMGNLYRLAGGIPVPNVSKGTIKSFLAMEEVIKKDKGWLHVYPEAACWEYYSPIREFKPGTFRIAYDHKVPVFPIAFSFRPAKGLFKLWKKNRPLVNVNLGEPIYANNKLDRKDGIEDLCKRVHEAVVKLAGFSSENENDEYKKKYIYYPYVNPYLEQYEKFKNN